MIMRFGIIVLILLSGLAQAQKKEKETVAPALVLFSIREWPV